MEIIKTNADLTNKKEVYKLTKSESVRVQDVEPGTSIPVEKYALYIEEKADGTKQNVLAVVGGGIKVATISKTFIATFMECVDFMGDDDFSIIITGGTSKAGRKYVSCELDCN